MQIKIGNVQMDNVSAEEALVLLKGVADKEAQVKHKRAYIKKGKSFEWIKWTEAENALMEDKISKNFSAVEVVKQKLFPAHTDASIYTKFYEARRKMMRRRKNAPKFVLPATNTTSTLPSQQTIKIVS